MLRRSSRSRAKIKRLTRVLTPVNSRSDLPATGYSQEALTGDVIGFIAALKLERPFLWGYSNGARTAAEVTAATPNGIRAVILEDPPWRAETAQFTPPSTSTP